MLKGKKAINMMFYMSFCMQITQTNAETEPFKSIRTAVELFSKNIFVEMRTKKKPFHIFFRHLNL